jgi:predicted nuclease of predicted toxin-antitoxin system
VRYLLDEDVPPTVGAGLRPRGLDAVSVYDVGWAGLRISDADQLEYAAAEGRVLVSYNRDDFLALDRAWRAAGREHAGILWCSDRIIPRRAIGTLIEAVLAMDATHAPLAGLCLPLQRPALSQPD